MDHTAPGLAPMAFTPREACGLCEGRDLRPVRQIDCFPILECADCGFLQTGRLLDEESLGRYYTSGYGGNRQRQGQEVNAEVNLWLLKRANALPPRGGRMLDIGCGYGFLLGATRRRHDIGGIGIELAEAELSFARNTLNLDVRGSLDAIAGETFDLVVLLETIEHILQPVDFMRRATACVKPGGLIAVCTDNFRSPLVRSMGDHFPKWIPHQHVSLFDDRTLPDLFQRVGGLAIEHQSSFTPWELEAQRLLRTATGGKRGGKAFTLESESRTENSRPYPLFGLRRAINPLWAGATSTRTLRGELMLVVARRKG